MLEQRNFNNKLIEIETYKEILHVSAKAAEMPVEAYIKRLLNDKNFIAPSLSNETIVLIRFRIILIHIEKEFSKIEANLTKLHGLYKQEDSNSPLLKPIEARIELIQKLLNKIRKIRFNLNYHFS